MPPGGAIVDRLLISLIRQTFIRKGKQAYKVARASGFSTDWLVHGPPCGTTVTAMGQHNLLSNRKEMGLKQNVMASVIRTLDLIKLFAFCRLSSTTTVSEPMTAKIALSSTCAHGKPNYSAHL